MEVVLFILGIIFIFAGKNNKDNLGDLTPLGKKLIRWGKICIGITLVWVLLGVVFGCIQGVSDAYKKKQLIDTYRNSL